MPFRVSSRALNCPSKTTETPSPAEWSPLGIARSTSSGSISCRLSEVLSTRTPYSATLPSLRRAFNFRTFYWKKCLTWIVCAYSLTSWVERKTNYIVRIPNANSTSTLLESWDGSGGVAFYCLSTEEAPCPSGFRVIQVELVEGSDA